jgi:hypothetical protein
MQLIARQVSAGCRDSGFVAKGIEFIHGSADLWSGQSASELLADRLLHELIDRAAGDAGRFDLLNERFGNLKLRHGSGAY